MRLDQKSARKIVQGRLKDHELDVFEAFENLRLEPKGESTTKSNAKQQRIENTVKEAFGGAFIGGGWTGRTYHYFIFERLDHEDGRPTQLAISGRSYNTRTNAERHPFTAVITMHAMERLIERRRDTDLIKVASEEFDLGFLNSMVFGDLAPNHDFKIMTAHGEARGVVNEDGIPIVKTWIHDPEKISRPTEKVGGND